MSQPRTLPGPLGAIWRAIGRPLYRRLLGRYFDAIIARLNSTLGQLTTIRSELSDVRERLDEVVAFQNTLDQQMRNIAAERWDGTAVGRRLSSIEDRLGASELAQ